MAIVMSAGETDDPGFIEVLNSILSELIAEHAPDQFWVIQIDNWFDHKWLGFSGMGLIASNIPLNTYDTVKAESYQQKGDIPAVHAKQGGRAVLICAGWESLRRVCAASVASQQRTKTQRDESPTTNSRFYALWMFVVVQRQHCCERQGECDGLRRHSRSGRMLVRRVQSAAGMEIAGYQGCQPEQT